MRVRLAWSLFALTVLVSVAHVVLLVASRRPVLSTGVIAEGFPLVTLGALAGAAIGAVIVTREPGHPIGWLFVVGQLLSELGLALGTYGHSALSGQLGSAPGGHVAVWLSIQLGGLFAVALLAVLFLLAPDGRPASPRWTWALLLPVGGLAASFLAVATVDPRDLDRNGDLTGGAGPVLTGVLVAASLMVGVGVLVGTLCLWRRHHRARGEERQQLRWIVVAAAGLAIGVVVDLLLVSWGAPEWTSSLPVMAAYACVPVFAGIAILRYRLYDIDIFLDRAVTLAVLTGFVGIGYVGLVVVIGTIFPFTDGAFWPSLLATAVVALAVQPLRGRAERLADRLVYGARAAPYVELAEFSTRLQGQPGTDELLRRVAEAVGGAVGARSTTIRVDVPGHAPTVVDWPEDSPPGPGATLTLPVVDGDFRLGDLSVRMPPGTQVRPEEQRLLADFVVQLARAFRNIRLETALEERVERLRRSTRLLEASARRLDLALDTTRRRFEDDLARTVVPHLARVQEGLGRLAEDLDVEPSPDEGVVASRLDDLSRHTQAALESLRTLTRGVFPTQLTRQGLAAALGGHLERTGQGVLHTSPSADRRFDPRIESAAYFCAVELLRELDHGAEIHLSASSERLTLEVGAPAPAPAAGTIEHLHDRADALDGRLEITEADGAARLVLSLPLRSAADLVPDAAQASGVELGLGDVGTGSAP